MKIILDTNIWISFLLGKKLSELTEIFKREDIKIYVSESLIREIREVSNRSKFSKYITPRSIEALMELIAVKCDYIDSDIQEDPEIRDKKDIFILGMAKNIPANLIVIGDKDLLVLENFGESKIVTFHQFKKEYLELK